MKCIISEEKKIESLVALLFLLKNSSQMIRMQCKEEYIYIQGMDKSHVCLYDVYLQNVWFSEYEVSESQIICVSTNTLHSILSSASHFHNVILYTKESDLDRFHIDLNVKNEYKQDGLKDEYSHEYSIPLMDEEMDYLDVGEVESDADFCISTKRISDVLAKMTHFGETLTIECDETMVKWSTKGVQGHMTVLTPIDELNTYSIVEGMSFSVSYNLSLIQKLCLQPKISPVISFGVSKTNPMMMKYSLTERTTKSVAVFYLAPKIDDND
jgi:proliferating cell nuclear antigen PCNA